jgi:hypothetical protein
MEENLKHLRILTIRFDLPIRYEELSNFRGAIIHLTKEKNDFFHNHSETGVIYRYPKIQYKKLNGKAALVCLDEGTEAIHDFFAGFHEPFVLGDQEVELKVEDIKASQFNVGVWESSFDYQLANWLPLNQENYNKYNDVESYHEKMQILEGVLFGNLLTFCEGIGMTSERPVKAAITRIVSEKKIKYRGTLMQAYDVDFKTNLSIPNFIGLGKGSGLGFGVVTNSKPKQTRNTHTAEADKTNHK